jgi:hypothetical protein
MNLYSQLIELHHLTCRSPWDLTCVTFLYKWFPRVSRVRRRRYDPYQRVALGGFSTPCVGSTQCRWLHHCTDLRGVRVWAFGHSPLQVIVTVLPHPDHDDWFDLSFVYWGFITHETIESAALRVLTDFCDHNPTVVALSPFGVFPVESSRPSLVGPYGSPTGAVVAS